ncbi:hypothetical protein QQX09_03855 [Demequina sp. SYSU T00192]|uniref:Uncharacterized protein n=1 Tax=Demequina litoralis TaxID=3051660 RepID=A0ABT8G776_9MICO|nr:hypothetical protein [Demequina sp. SYSU T00192]MDN4474989.1 hypothetical protein [Demequina sp. SYSU T00192]
MRWWIVGGIVAALVVAVLAVPVLPAADEAEAPIEGTWTFESPVLDACIEVTVDATLVGREVRPLVSALPWRRWADTTLADPVEIAVGVPSGCEPENGTMGLITGDVMIGTVDCGEWVDAWDDDPTLPEADHRFGCGGDAVWFTLATDDATAGVSLTDSLAPGELHADARGCVDVQVWGLLSVQHGDSQGSDSPVADREVPQRVCLEPAA